MMFSGAPGAQRGGQLLCGAASRRSDGLACHDFAHRVRAEPSAPVRRSPHSIKYAPYQVF